jgi:hypothetical protein
MKNKTIELTILELETLANELNGMTNNETNEIISKGFLKEKLKLVTKFWLNELNTEVLEILKNVNDLKKETFTSLGTTDDKGNVTVQMFLPGSEVYDESGKLIDAKINPAYEKLQIEMNSLYAEVRSIKYRPIPLSELSDIITEENYSILYKLIESPTDGE